MTNHLMNSLCMPKWMFLQIAMLRNYIRNLKSPSEYSCHGYPAPRLPYSMAHLLLHLTYWCTLEGQHTNPKWKSILLKGPKLQQTANHNGMTKSMIQLHGTTWVKSSRNYQLAAASNFQNIWTIYYQQPNDSKFLTINMTDDALNVDSCGKTQTMFYNALVMNMKEQELMHLRYYENISSDNTLLLSWQISFVIPCHIGSNDNE